MNVDDLKNSGRFLEDLFFMENDKRLIEQQKKIKQLKETKENLQKVSGIHNEAILQKLVQLDIQPGIVASLSIIPLVEVAWADGEADEKEIQAVMKCAEKSGFSKNGIDHELLNTWLKIRPPEKMLEAWSHYISGLCEKMSEKEKGEFKSELLNSVYDIAKASGGILGIGGISSSEKEVIAKLEKAFQ